MSTRGKGRGVMGSIDLDNVGPHRNAASRRVTYEATLEVRLSIEAADEREAVFKAAQTMAGIGFDFQGPTGFREDVQNTIELKSIGRAGEGS